MEADVLLNPETRIAIGYAPAAARAGLETLFALDTRLAGIVARTSEATIGLMRLVWWRDALAALDTPPPPAEPLLAAAAGLGLPGAALAAMSEGWESLLDDPAVGDETVDRHAAERGARLFRLAGRLLGSDDPRLGEAGDGWARVDLARHLADGPRSAAILRSAAAPLASANHARWPRALRPLGQFAALAERDARAGSLQAPATRGRLLRIARFQLTGR